MSPEEYRKLALATESTDYPYRLDKKISRLMHALLGITTETGELHDAVKRELVYGKSLDNVNIVEECGDLLWYVNLALDAVGSSLSEAMEKNIAKLRVRFPDKFNAGDALERDLDAERAALEGEIEEIEIEEIEPSPTDPWKEAGFMMGMSPETGEPVSTPLWTHPIFDILYTLDGEKYLNLTPVKVYQRGKGWRVMYGAQVLADTDTPDMPTADTVDSYLRIKVERTCFAPEPPATWALVGESETVWSHPEFPGIYLDKTGDKEYLWLNDGRRVIAIYAPDSFPTVEEVKRDLEIFNRQPAFVEGAKND